MELNIIYKLSVVVGSSVVGAGVVGAGVISSATVGAAVVGASVPSTHPIPNSKSHPFGSASLSVHSVMVSVQRTHDRAHAAFAAIH